MRDPITEATRLTVHGLYDNYLPIVANLIDRTNTEMTSDENIVIAIDSETLGDLAHGTAPGGQPIEVPALRYGFKTPADVPAQRPWAGFIVRDPITGNYGFCGTPAPEKGSPLLATISSDGLRRIQVLLEHLDKSPDGSMNSDDSIDLHWEIPLTLYQWEAWAGVAVDEVGDSYCFYHRVPSISEAGP